jgi:hypothetical protein
LAASLVDEASRGSSILWRVMCRYDLHSHHGSIWREKGAILDEASPEMVFSGEVNAARDGHALEPFASLASDYGPSHRTAPWWRPMPALLSLGAELVQTGVTGGIGLTYSTRGAPLFTARVASDGAGLGGTVDRIDIYWHAID